MAFRQAGFVTVNLGYRLVDASGLQQPVPLRRDSPILVKDQVSDVAAAVQAFRRNAPGWGAGTGRMYMGGHSAGAVLALLYAMGPQNRGHHIRACANWAGATDLSIPGDAFVSRMPPSLKELYRRAAGVAPSVANNERFKALSPYWVVSDGGPAVPCISIYPEYNTVFGTPGEVQAGWAQTQLFHDLLRKRGIRESLSRYRGSDHSFRQPADARQRLVAETAVFFRAV
jgi:acetyl esterase/lipase